MHNGPIVVAIVNTNPDLVRLLRMNLERAGFVVFEIHIEDIKLGAANVNSFLEQHDPKVIVYDVAPPYDMNWRFLDHLRSSTGFKGRQFVLTSVNVRHVEELVGTDESVYEILGEEDDILQVVRAVKEASRARSTR
jgi:CheY-like chemotaxis protein